MKFCLKLAVLIFTAFKKGDLSDRIFSLLVASVINIPLTQLIEKYVFKDFEMLGYVAVLLMVDTGSGVLKHWINKTFSAEGFHKAFIKFIVCGFALIVSHVVNQISHSRGAETIGDFIETMIYSGIAVYLIISIAENLLDLSGGKFPPLFIRKHLKKYESTGKIANEDELNVTSIDEEINT